VETLGEYAFLLDVPDGHSFPAWERSVADYEASAMQPRISVKRGLLALFVLSFLNLIFLRIRIMR
jgi:hypothetical protein